MADEILDITALLSVASDHPQLSRQILMSVASVKISTIQRNREGLVNVDTMHKHCWCKWK